MASLLLIKKQIEQITESTMRRKKKQYPEVIPLPKRYTALNGRIGAVIEDIVCWICVLACAVLLLLLSGRSVSAAEPGTPFFYKYSLTNCIKGAIKV